MTIMWVSWSVHGHRGGGESFGMSMDIGGGVIQGVHRHKGGSSLMSMDIRGFILVVYGHMGGGAFGITMDIQEGHLCCPWT
jgi:hypothetical protein